MRNEQGRWAEDLVIDTINDTEKFSAVRYGLSRVVLVRGERVVRVLGKIPKSRKVW